MRSSIDSIQNGWGSGSPDGALGPRPPAPFLARAVLLFPDRVQEGLDRVRAAGLVDPVPNLWQLTQGVLRMWHRILFRSETIGTSTADPVRPTWRARLLHRRPIRFPFLVLEGAIAPLDLTGLASTPERIIRHLRGAHHDGAQFAYDLQILSCSPGRLEELRDAVREVVLRDTPRSRWLRDLTVYEGYHERLLSAVTRAIEGDFGLSEREANDPDIAFTGYLRWCAAQPETPGETLQALLDSVTT